MMRYLCAFIYYNTHNGQLQYMLLLCDKNTIRVITINEHGTEAITPIAPTDLPLISVSMVLRQ